MLEFIRQHKTAAAVAICVVILIGLGLFLYSAGSDYLFKRQIDKKKEAIAEQVNEIANISNQIANLELKKSGTVANINNDTEELARAVFGLEEAKKATNAALANFNAAVNSNSNIDRTAEDLLRQVQKLDNTQ